MFEEAIAQVKVIEEVMIQNGKIKVIKKENNNRGYGSNKSGAPNRGKPQVNQLILQAPTPTPIPNV